MSDLGATVDLAPLDGPAAAMALLTAIAAANPVQRQVTTIVNDGRDVAVIFPPGDVAAAMARVYALAREWLTGDEIGQAAGRALLRAIGEPG